MEQVNGQTVIIVYVPEAPPAAKPIFLSATGLPRGAWRRIGSSDQRCTEEDIWALRGQESPSDGYDASPVQDSGFDDIDPAALAEYRRLRTQVNGEARLTLAGLLLFGKAPALRRLAPATRVDYIRVLGTEWVEDPERRFQSVDIRKALLLTIRQAEAAIVDDLPRGFNLPEGSLQSVQEPILPQKVIRETLANALIKAPAGGSQG